MTFSGFRILSWNINGLKSKLKDKKKKLFEIFDKYDVLLLQETKIGKPNQGSKKKDDDWGKITMELSDKGYACENLEDLEFNEDEEQKKIPKTMYMTYFSSNNKGVAILINKPHILLSADCEGGDYAWVHVEIDKQKYTFVSVYCCGRDSKLNLNLMFKIFCSFLTDESDAFKSRLVIGGDFNTTLDPALDANKEMKGHAARRERLNDFMSIAKLSDVWRKENSSQREYTYHHYNGTKSRLDYVFMLENDVNCVRHCKIRNEIALSDHFPVSLTLNINTTNTNDRHLASNIQQHREE